MNDIPVIDSKDENFEDKLNFEIWSTGSSSDYRNDRKRPYNGQRHTDQGERGKTIVEGLTMRDIADCFIQGFLSASCDPILQNKTFEIHKDAKTKYASKGTWRYQDVYKIKMDIDPLAVVQNALCFVEYYMGIFPNVNEAEAEKAMRELFGK